MSATLPADVLFVDDDPDMRALVALTLAELAGVRVRTCTSGAEALAEAARDPPDLLLLDVMMPGMDGIEVRRHLLADPRTARIPVILLTARVGPADLDLYAGLGVLGVIAKPFDPLELPETIGRMWNGDRDRAAACRAG